MTLQRYAPLRRKTPLKRSTKRIKSSRTLFQNSFHHGDIIAVYGTTELRCCLSGKRPAERSHVMGRKHECCSSILNLAPLDHDIHAWGVRDHSDMRRLLLRLSYEKVMQAVGQGRYTLKENDFAFTRWANQEIESHGLPSLYII